MRPAGRTTRASSAKNGSSSRKFRSANPQVTPSTASSATGSRSASACTRGVVPVIGGLLSDPAAYRYLPRSVAYLPDPADMLAMLAGHGFERVERTLLSTGIAQLVTATRS